MSALEAGFAAETPLAAIIRETILTSPSIGETDNGDVLSAIPFHQYMTLCLYHPEFGYYRSGTSRVGREGDFYTSAYVGELMGEQLASELMRLADEWLTGVESIEVMDWGGGTGRLGRHMMDTWEKASHSEGLEGTRAERFILTVVEGNPAHRRQAIEELADYIELGKARVIGNEEGSSMSFPDHPVIIVANELLDAFPVYRLVKRGGRLREWGVVWEEAGRRFIPCLMDPTNPRLEEWIDNEGVRLLDNQTIEVNLDAADWVADLASRLDRAMLVFIDYGDETEELITPHRMDGTLLCYYKHRAHNDPYLLPGEQDLTTHVNFSHIRRVAVHSGWKELRYGTQKKFLVESGILEKLSAHSLTDPFHPTVRRNRAIRQLLLSDGMSELFKVQIFVKA
ncbi:class I SAM-dependent methyltransferase [Cohnella silvisoli]|uniref:SAM-dependent methyltransferase n=1 Tax=Cohnella silvisoli TaxID=2873699 RepID=A0ABV1KYJ6_9BACL|nr:SAM-dependent methyltransferase [Cohnella silvisoli]MCD9024452.1 SAM-dependent methyltransferase [Cohnella silvisoli]